MYAFKPLRAGASTSCIYIYSGHTHTLRACLSPFLLESGISALHVSFFHMLNTLQNTASVLDLLPALW